MAKKKKAPFRDARGKWYALMGKRKPRPFSERAIKKALKAIKRAKEADAQSRLVSHPLSEKAAKRYKEKRAEIPQCTSLHNGGLCCIRPEGHPMPHRAQTEPLVEWPDD